MFSALLIRVMTFVAFCFFIYAFVCVYEMVVDLIKRRKNPDRPIPKSPMEQIKALARTQKKIKQAEEESEPKFDYERQRIEWGDWTDINEMQKL